MREYILCAAIWINDHKQHANQPENISEGFVLCGRRHSNCYQAITDLIGDCDEYLSSLNIPEEDLRKYQGFITSADRYVDRKDAWKIAKDNNQVIYGLTVSDNGDESILISENLY